MALSKAAICNVALSYIGAGKQISSLTEVGSTAASTCNLHYDAARKEVLQELNWPFARKYVDLGLVAEDPTTEWGYAYRYPSDCLKVRRIVTGIRNDPNPPPFEIGQDDQGKLIYTDQDEATIEYTKDEENYARFDAMFDDALSWKLGGKIAPSLSKLKGAVDLCMKQYLIALSVAGARAFNQEEGSDTPDAESVRVRS